MALTCKQLFGDGVFALAHIQELVARLVDGFGITNNLIHDNYAMQSIATSFATTFGSRVHRVQDVAYAFIEGLKSGTDAIEFYARRRRPAKRRVLTT
jgi:hypothetical protein